MLIFYQQNARKNKFKRLGIATNQNYILKKLWEDKIQEMPAAIHF
jgi:hypothetical protein